MAICQAMLEKTPDCLARWAKAPGWRLRLHWRHHWPQSGTLKERSIKAVIPPKANHKVQRSCDWYLYKERHVIECMFGKLKYYRRIATHFEKKAHHFKEMLAFAAVLL